MTLDCARCGCRDIELVDDNGAEYPETRVEFYECRGCGREFREVLTA
jgi:DNA-directed RNA polymerase subunit M/transcription elongation factor TFIIS